MTKKLALPLLILSVYCIGLAIGPRVPDDLQGRYCVRNVYFIWPFGLSLNCDSFNYLEEAANPAFLLHPKAIHQARPGHIVLVHIAGYPVRWITQIALAGLNLEESLSFDSSVFGIEDEFRRTTIISPEELTATVRLFIPYFVTYFLIDILFLSLGFWLYLRLVQPHIPIRDVALPVILIGLLLVINDMTKAHLLSPHSQVFNIFVPLFALFAFVMVWRDIRFLEWILLSALIALGVLSYGYFAIVVPTCVLAFIIGDLEREQVDRRAVIRWLIYPLAMLLVVALPYLIWYGYVISVNGAFYSYEVDCCNQIVWMAETWKAGPSVFFSRWFENFWFFLQQALLGAGVIYLLLIVAGILWASAGRPRLELSSQNKMVVVGATVVSLLTIVFYAFLGYRVWRLAYGAIVPFIVICGLLYNALIAKITPNRIRIAETVVLTLVVWFTAFVIGKDGPWT